MVLILVAFPNNNPYLKTPTLTLPNPDLTGTWSTNAVKSINSYPWLIKNEIML